MPVHAERRARRRIMPTRYTIRQGDSIVDVAYRHGFFADTVWNHPDNTELRERRKNKNILMPGDVLIIPDKRPKEHTGDTGRRHRFRVLGIPAVLRLQLFDDDEPRADQSYRITIRGPGFEKTTAGTTDGEGVLEVSCPPSATEGEIVVGPDELHLELRLGHLDPIGELTGVQKRLNNLGFDCGEPNGQLGPSTQHALLIFQARFGLEETGEPDDATRALLEKLHDKRGDMPEEPAPEP